MDDKRTNAKPVVYWVSAVFAPEESLQIDMLRNDFSMREYDSFECFMDNYEDRSNGCVVMRREYFGSDADSLLLEIVRRNNIAKVILCVSAWEIPEVVRAIKLGFTDVLRLPSDVEHIRQSIDRAIESDRITGNNYRVDIPHDILTLLNAEEARIFCCLVQRVTNKQISRELGLSIRTIHYRKKSIFEKLKVENRGEAVELLRNLQR